MSLERLITAKLTRRRAMLASLAGGTALLVFGSAEAATQVSLICPRIPDPVPPGYGGYGQAELKDWQDRYNAYLSVEAVAWEQIHDKIVAGFDGRAARHDVNYTAGWIPEFSPDLLKLDGLIQQRILADLPASSAHAVIWQNQRFGLPLTISILTLYSNSEHLRDAGIAAPPATWSDLKAVAKELTTKQRSGWIANYGTPGGIGGVASYFMVFLQQAGGTMYMGDGRAAFNTHAGLEALQCMVDLMPFTHPSSLSLTSINGATAAFMNGEASMMMNWPFMWDPLNDRQTSPLTGKVQTSLLPAGPAGTASIDGADAWTISAKTKQQDLATRLISFFLSVEMQVQQAVATGWLPVRRSAYDDARVTRACPQANVVAQQAQHPYSSFLTPDYEAITEALGREIIKALAGKEEPKVALAAAERSVNAIVNARD